MSIERHFDEYPHIKETFWMLTKDLTYKKEKPHPLLYLILGESSTNKSVAYRTDKGCQLVQASNPTWLKSKANIIVNEKDYTSVSAALGEIRAYGELIWIFGDKMVQAGSAGNDFSINLEGKCIKIEVNTPQGRSKRQEIDHGTVVKSDRISMQIKEIFPFGWPEREIDNVQGEATSKLAGIKQKEHQFRTECINILWLDLKDPLLWPMEFYAHQFRPLSAFREEITSGSFWAAFYGTKGMPIYDQLNMQGLASKTYRMEYDGRFQAGKSMIDFVIADALNHQVVFQNHMRQSDIPAEVFRRLHNLFAFNLDLSSLDWPVPGKLCSRIEAMLNTISAYEHAFDID